MASPVGEITIAAVQLDCLPPTMTRQGETKSASQSRRRRRWGLFVLPRCLLQCDFKLVCRRLNACALHGVVCIPTLYMCPCCGPWAMRNPAGRKRECIHPGSQGPGATQVPNKGMKGCSADVTHWGSVAQPANVMFGSWHAAALPPVVGRGVF